MGQKSLKKHRNLHAVCIPCPVCKEYRPETNATLTVRIGRYTSISHDLKWDGAAVYIDKKVEKNKVQKRYYQVKCDHCIVDASVATEEELPGALKELLAAVMEDLVKVPTPPGNVPFTKQQINTSTSPKKYVFKLAKRNSEVTKEDEDCVPTA